MTESEYRALEATGVVFLCGGVEYDLVDLLPQPEEDEPCR